MQEVVLRHLRNSFFADEPLNNAVNLCERGQPHAGLEKLCIATIADGLSVAAMENGSVRILIYYDLYFYHSILVSNKGLQAFKSTIYVFFPECRSEESEI